MSKRALQLKTEDGGVLGFLLLAAGADSTAGTCVVMVVPGAAGDTGKAAGEALQPWSQGAAGECTFSVGDDHVIHIEGKPGELVFGHEGEGRFTAALGNVTIVAIDGQMASS